MKLLIIVYNGLWDACLPLIESLQDKCDLWCGLELIPEHSNILNIKPDDFHGERIISGSTLSELNKYSNILPINQTFIIRKKSPKRIINFCISSIAERKFIETINPDFVYFFHDPIYSLSFIFSSKIKWGIAVHDPAPHGAGRKGINYLRKIIFYKCENFFLFSESLKTKFIDNYHLHKKNIYSTLLGVYSHLYTLYGTRSLIKKNKSQILKILFFGNIHPYKGLKYLLEAIKMLREAGYNNIEITVAGRGHIEDTIIDLVEENGIYVINSFVPEELLASFIEESDVVICPYTEATQSGVIMSAYAFCTPVIATNVGGLVDMVQDGVTGRLIEACSSHSIVEAIIDILNNPQILNEWRNNIHKLYYTGRNGRNSIAKNFIQDVNSILDRNDI